MEFMEIGLERLEELLVLMRERAQWMADRGESMWNPDYLVTENFLGKYKNPRCFMAWEAGMAVGGLVLVNEDDMWQGEEGNAYYVHKLVVRPQCGGKGYARAMLEKVKEEGRKAEKVSIRLDYYEDRPYLVMLYQQCGFIWKGTRIMPDGTPIAKGEFLL